MKRLRWLNHLMPSSPEVRHSCVSPTRTGAVSGRQGAGVRRGVVRPLARDPGPAEPQRGNDRIGGFGGRTGCAAGHQAARARPAAGFGGTQAPGGTARRGPGTGADAGLRAAGSGKTVPLATGPLRPSGRWPGCRWARATTTQRGSGATRWPRLMGRAPGIGGGRPGLHLVLATRADPPLALARLRGAAGSSPSCGTRNCGSPPVRQRPCCVKRPGRHGLAWLPGQAPACIRRRARHARSRTRYRRRGASGRDGV